MAVPKGQTSQDIRKKLPGQRIPIIRQTPRGLFGAFFSDKREAMMKDRNIMSGYGRKDIKH